MSKINVKNVGDGEVVLLSGGGKIFTDIAARFVDSDRDLKDIVSSEYDAKLVRNILASGHTAATEFDYFIFGIQGYSRVTEIQLVRKRIASYMIKSGRTDKNKGRTMDMVIPSDLKNIVANVPIKASSIMTSEGKPLNELIGDQEVFMHFNYNTLFNMTDIFYEAGIDMEIPEERLRYMKQQATEFRAIIGMNARALMDLFKVRCCMRAQDETRDLANKMLALCKEAAPDLFKYAGPNCLDLGYCPENGRQHAKCKGKIITKKQALEILNPKPKMTYQLGKVQ